MRPSRTRSPFSPSLTHTRTPPFSTASGNPGPSGAGAVLLGPGGRPLAEAAQWLGHATNNEAEYRALLAGLRLAARVPGVRRLLVEGDSTLVTNQMKGEWKVEAPGLRPLWTAAREAARAFDACEFRYIPREENSAVRLLLSDWSACFLFSGLRLLGACVLSVFLTRCCAQADALANCAMDSRVSHAWKMDAGERDAIADFAWEVNLQ